MHARIAVIAAVALSVVGMMLVVGALGGTACEAAPEEEGQRFRESVLPVLEAPATLDQPVHHVRTPGDYEPMVLAEVPEDEELVVATTWSGVGAGFDTACALRTDGTLWCWGNNSAGQLDDGTTTGIDMDKKVIRIALAHKLLVQLNAKARDARKELAIAA